MKNKLILVSLILSILVGTIIFLGINLVSATTWQSSYNVGLVAYYKLDDNTGTIAKDSVRSILNGTIIAGTGGKWNDTTKLLGTSSYQFGGVDTNITLPNDLQLVNEYDMTWALWVYPTLASCSASYDTILTGGNFGGGEIFDLSFATNTCQIRFFTTGLGIIASVNNLKSNA